MLAVISDGLSISQVASKVGVSHTHPGVIIDSGQRLSTGAISERETARLHTALPAFHLREHRSRTATSSRSVGKSPAK